MWNFSFVLPSLLILFILIAFYLSLPRLSVRKNRVFVWIILAESTTIVFDILSSYVDNDPAAYPMIMVQFFNVGYFAAFYIRSFLFYYFTLSLLSPEHALRPGIKALSKLPVGLMLLCTLLTPMTGWIYSIGPEGYHSGPLYNLTYLQMSVYLLLSFGTIVLFHRPLKKRERFAVILFNLLLLAGMIFRYVFPHFLLMDTFCLMAILIIYLEFENPEFYLELRGEVFNGKAFRDYIEENTGRLSGRVLGVVIHNYPDMRDIYGSHQMDVGMHMIARYLVSSFPHQTVFYYRKGRFILLGEKNMDCGEMSRRITERFQKTWKSDEAELYLKSAYLTMELGGELSEADDILSTLILAFKKADITASSVPVAVTADEVLQTRLQHTVRRALEKAIEQDQVEVFLQPLMEADSGKLIAAEALARIRDEKGEIIPPGLFISVAERSGRIHELGEQVFEKTCRFLKTADLSSLGIRWINVNLSPVQFMRSDLADCLEKILRIHGLEPALIHLEITEESMIDDSFLQKQMQSVREKGFQLVLDDYGTGYSNLTRLKICPFTNVKLDMSLVWDYCANPDDILPTMIKAFKHMNFTITSEGIENEQMADMMRRIGSDYLQGYHYSKPLSMEDFMEKYAKPAAPGGGSLQ